MRRGFTSVSGVSHVPDDGSPPNDLPGFQAFNVGVEMSVVIGPGSTSGDEDGIASEFTSTNPCDDAVRGGEHGCTSTSKDVLTLVVTFAGPGRVPGISDGFRGDALYRHDQGHVCRLG